MADDQVKVFLSYSRDDSAFKDTFIKHLSVLVRSENISIWTDDNIEGGREWNPFIEKKLLTSDLILLLISPSFVASDYCYNVEVKKAIQMHNTRKAVVLPIGLTPVEFSHLEFAKIQMLPKKPPPFIQKWPNIDDAFTSVISEIRTTINVVLKEMKQWDPLARNKLIREFLESSMYDDACNKLIDYVRDFSQNDDLVYGASNIKSDYSDLKVLKTKMETEENGFEKYYRTYTMDLKSIKDRIFTSLRQVIEENSKTTNYGQTA